MRNTITAAYEGVEKEYPVSAVYSGRNGCACGCNGTHSSSQRSITTVINKIEKFAAEGKGTLDVQPDSYVALLNEDNDRLYVAYTDGRTAS